jgi:hypothetical protein
MAFQDVPGSSTRWRYPSKPWLPDGIFQTENPNFGKFWNGMEEAGKYVCRCMVYFTAIWNILGPSGTFYDHLVIYVASIWYIFPHFGTLCH